MLREIDARLSERASLIRIEFCEHCLDDGYADFDRRNYNGM